MNNLKIKDKRIVGVYLTSYLEIEQELEDGETIVSKVRIETSDDLEEKIKSFLELKYLSIPIDSKSIKLDFVKLLEAKLQNRGSSVNIKSEDANKIERHYNPFIKDIKHKTLPFSRAYGDEVIIPYHIKRVTLIDLNEKISFEERLLIDGRLVSGNEITGYLFKEKCELFL